MWVCLHSNFRGRLRKRMCFEIEWVMALVVDFGTSRKRDYLYRHTYLGLLTWLQHTALSTASVLTVLWRHVTLLRHNYVILNSSSQICSPVSRIVVFVVCTVTFSWQVSVQVCVVTNTKKTVGLIVLPLSTHLPGRADVTSVSFCGSVRRDEWKTFYSTAQLYTVVRKRYSTSS